MKKHTPFAAMAAALFCAGGAAAESTPIAIDDLAFATVHEVAERSILARNDAGQPLAALLKLDDGDFLPPHGAGGGLRLLTVLSGELSWGDGAEVDPDKERIFPAGTVLIVPAEGGEHWAAARGGDVLIQVVFIREGALAAGIPD
ncbi:hypothetical protein [Hyphococcus luteus]|uniref:Cupin type-1 domain-containing protein n=1 Tax=Hyphococcus luteus TaxID=2058213 RepID=A0A2S7KB20_9PROT|nr:hypothetical protein [Marinicaulis flavus]PQA89705.1 hypothetical protein CW354_02285 [Marinicaulis flavus]